ncbi:hypothetical protein AB0L63_16560 [Nocardia sp. NPDC051990]|uniref:hypothetical protein n=1 Tax=Nocardia sp. NPDC051990 TaxID=3155285 RepID=UPI003448BE7A
MPAVTVVAPALPAEHSAAVGLLAAHRDAGVERVILAPTGPAWEDDYADAAKFLAAL